MFFSFGQSDVFRLRRSGSYQADKTLLIEYLLQKKEKIHIIAAPLHFGKTSTQSMLELFFSQNKCEDAELFFHGTQLIQQGGLYKEHQSKYLVISFSLLSAMNQPNLEFGLLSCVISSFFKCLKNDAELMAFCREEAQGLHELQQRLRENLEEGDWEKLTPEFSTCLKVLLTAILAKVGAKEKRLIFLVDNYDEFYLAAYPHRVERVQSLMQVAFFQPIQASQAVFKIVLTGNCLLPCQYIFGNDENMSAEDLRKSELAAFLGLNLAEMQDILMTARKEDFISVAEFPDGLTEDEFCQRYGGYKAAGTLSFSFQSVFYAARSQDRSMKNKIIDVESVLILLKDKCTAKRLNEFLAFEKDLRILLKGQCLIKPIYPSLNLQELKKGIEPVWTLLFFVGALSLVSLKQDALYEVKISNPEWLRLYQNLAEEIRAWITTLSALPQSLPANSDLSFFKKLKGPEFDVKALKVDIPTFDESKGEALSLS